ncbi:hypothetical protein H0H93_013276 [Arthromyces matolae]|nr:hypothetical protein H0H93_013276 [Arthromyces matolae]
MDLDEELAMLATPDTIGMTMPSTPRSLPTTPFSHDLDIPYDEKLYTSNKDNFFDHLEPPLYEIPFLPELDDIPDSPSSPSLRSFSTLPPLEEDDDTDFRFESLHSPGTTLISLPGADTDDFLIPNDNDLEPSPSTSPFGSSSSLLLLEDDVLPRSPSPENYDVEDVDSVSIAGSSDPDIRRLGELQRRSQNAERAARQLEQTLLEEGAVHQRWEARRARKKEKERGREIGAMLRFKIAQEKERLKKTMDVDNILNSESEGGREGEEESPKVQEKMKIPKRRGTIGSMEQLVAKMLLRRNDTYRSLANRKTPLTSKFYMSSPLVHYGELYDGDNQQQTTSPHWTATGEHEFEPWTPPEWTTSLPLQESSYSSSSC